MKPWHNPNTLQYTKDVDKARRLLREAWQEGYQNRTLKYSYIAGWDWCRIAGEQLQSDLAKIGISMELVAQASPARREGLNRPETAHDLYIVRWFPFYPDPASYLPVYYESTKWPPAGKNYGFVKISSVDSLLKEAAMESNRNRRIELYHRVQDILSEEAVAVQMWIETNVITYREWLKNVTYLPYDDLTQSYYDLYKEGKPASMRLPAKGIASIFFTSIVARRDVESFLGSYVSEMA
jgi:ABC-type transport system substrate-binding protein